MGEYGHPGDRLNRRFYEAMADDFVQKRQRPWPGWSRLPVPEPKDDDDRVRLLDVGCGHGRFLGDWIARDRPAVDYVGVDFSPALLQRARERVSLRSCDKARWFEGAFPNVVPRFDVVFDLVVAFGVLHHVTGVERRRSFMLGLSRLARVGGIVVVTVWRFGREPRFAHRGRTPSPELLELDPRAVILDFDGRGERLCVDIPDDELDCWGPELGLEVEGRFQADGRTGALNEYLVFVRADTSRPAGPIHPT